MVLNPRGALRARQFLHYPQNLCHLYQTPTLRLAIVRSSQCLRRCITTGGDVSPDFSAVREQMQARGPQVYSDEPNMRTSHLFARALADFFPSLAEDQSSYSSIPMPAGHHLLYFHLDNPSSRLCPDGTDPWSSPPVAGFTRRVWAAGSMDSLSSLEVRRRLQAVCREHITDVSIRGPPGDEKISVQIHRQYKSLRKDQMLDTASESRTLVFMRELSPDQVQSRLKLKPEEERVIAPHRYEAARSLTISPTRALLFQYSALTYNAHAIHLDPTHCREVEGYRNPLVQGPLLVMLMLELLRLHLSEIDATAIIDSVHYRLIAPLFVDEPMTINVAPRHTSRDLGDLEPPVLEKWDVWIVNQHGSLCAKGVVQTVAVALARQRLRPVITPENRELIREYRKVEKFRDLSSTYNAKAEWLMKRLNSELANVERSDTPKPHEARKAKKARRMKGLPGSVIVARQERGEKDERDLERLNQGGIRRLRSIMSPQDSNDS